MSLPLPINVAVPVGFFADSLIGIVFPKTTALAYPAMLALAARAARHVETADAGKRYHLVAFSHGAQGAMDAIALLEHARKLAGVQVFAKNRPCRDIDRVIDVLECYCNAETCSSVSAWCRQVIRAPIRANTLPAASVEISPHQRHPQFPMWLFPCRFLNESAFTVDPRHPDSYEHQIEAGAVKRGCHWCPLFSPANLAFLD